MSNNDLIEITSLNANRAQAMRARLMSTSKAAKTTLDKLFDEIERRIEKLERIIKEDRRKTRSKEK